MDSSRSGLLSTLLMTLPLIVVPAIALLRPPGQATGLSTTPLAASSAEEDDDFLKNAFKEIDELPDSSDVTAASGTGDGVAEPEDPFFRGPDDEGDSGPKARTPSKPSPKRPPSGPLESDPFAPGTTHARQGPAPDHEDTDHRPAEPSVSAKDIEEQLNAQGALRTMWFEAGAAAPVGFAVFFRGETHLVRLRFEAVGQSREECARNVLDQVTQWQSEQDAGPQN